MRSHLDRPGIVCATAVSLLTAVAVIAPSPARGDDTLQPQLPSVGAVAEVVTAATADALPAVQTDVPSAVDVVPGLEPAPASDLAVAAEPAAAPSDPTLSPAEQASRAVESNVRWTVRQILESPEGQARRAEGRTKIVGAVYEIETGRVRFLPADERT